MTYTPPRAVRRMLILNAVANIVSIIGWLTVITVVVGVAFGVIR